MSPGVLLRKRIGAKVSEARYRLGMTQSVLAAAAGVGLNSVQRIEDGAGNPDFDLVVAVATAAGLEIKMKNQ